MATITSRQPEAREVTRTTDAINLAVTATGANLAYTWTHNGSLTLPAGAEWSNGQLGIAAPAAAHDGEWKVVVAGDGEPEEFTWTVSGAPIPPSDPEGDTRPRVWDRDFAYRTLIGIGALIVLVVLLIAIWVAGLPTPSDAAPTPSDAAPAAGASSEFPFAGVVAVGLLGTAATLGVLGLWLATIELRGKSANPNVPEESTGSRSAFDEVAKVLPQALAEFAKLSVPLAALVAAIVAIICATVLGTKSLPYNGPPVTSATPSEAATTPPSSEESDDPAPGDGTPTELPTGPATGDETAPAGPAEGDEVPPTPTSTG